MEERTKTYEEFTDADWQQNEYMIKQMERAINDLNDKIGFTNEQTGDPEPLEIAAPTSMYKQLRRVSETIYPKEDVEQLGVKQETIDTLRELSLPLHNEPIKKSDPDETLVEKIRTATNMVTLQRIARQKGEFKALKSDLDNYKNAYELKLAMLDELNKTNEEINKKAWQAYNRQRIKRKSSSGKLSKTILQELAYIYWHQLSQKAMRRKDIVNNLMENLRQAEDIPNFNRHSVLRITDYAIPTLVVCGFLIKREDGKYEWPKNESNNTDNSMDSDSDSGENNKEN